MSVRSIYICVCIHTNNYFHLIYISYSQEHIYAQMLTHLYTQNVYSHDDTQKILYRNSRLLSDKLSLAISQTFIQAHLSK